MLPFGIVLLIGIYYAVRLYKECKPERLSRFLKRQGPMCKVTLGPVLDAALDEADEHKAAALALPETGAISRLAKEIEATVHPALSQSDDMPVRYSAAKDAIYKRFEQGLEPDFIAEMQSEIH